jgi:hypothetical protein
MPIVLNGSGTVTGISVGGLPDGCVDTDTLANGAATQAKRTYAADEIIQTKFFQNKTQYSNNSNTTPTQIISGAITPTNSSNKIFITYHAQVAYQDGQQHCHVQIIKSGNVIDAARGTATNDDIAHTGNKVIYIASTSDNNRTGVSGSYSDIAGSTSAITYAIGINVNGADTNYYCHANRSAHSTGYASSTELILTEVAV